MSTSNAGLRERKKERLRDELIRAAMTLFGRQGYDATTVEQIVESVNVSHRTFFRYFRQKEDLLDSSFRGGAACLRASLEARPLDEPPLLSLRHAYGDFIAFYESAHFIAVARMLADAATIGKKFKFGVCSDLTTQVLAARLTADPRLDFAPRLFSHVAQAIVVAAIDVWAARGAKESLAALVDEGFRTFEVTKLFSMTDVNKRPQQNRRPTNEARGRRDLRSIDAASGE